MGAFISLPPPVAIYLAVRAGRADEVKAIISQAYNGIPHPGCLEWKDELGDTALSIAAKNGDSGLVNLLLNLGSNCGHFSEQFGGMTALHQAVESVRIRPRLIETLLRSGANPFVENDYGETPWEIALSRKQTTVCRRFEQARNLFANHLYVEMKEEPKEHRRRWISVIPKYSSANQDTPIARYLYVFSNEQSSKYRQIIDLAAIKPPVVVRNSDGWKLFLGPVRRHSGPAVDGTNLVFVFGSDKPNRKLLEDFLTAIDPTRLLSLSPPPPKGKPIIPFKGLKLSPQKERRSREDNHRTTSSPAKNIDILIPKRYKRKQHCRSISETSQVTGPCVICLENPQTAGFAHGQSIHRCVCKRCALLFTKQKKQTTCPICRQEIEHIITDFF